MNTRLAAQNGEPPTEPFSDPARAVDTPSVVVDRARLLSNLSHMQQIAERRRVVLRPHIKTHKCVEIARLQIELGAVGVTCAKADEALVFIEAGIPSVTVAYPLIANEKVERLLSAAQAQGTDIRFIADSAAGVDALSAGAAAGGGAVPVFLKIDVGLHRCGLAEGAAELLPLARAIHGDPNLAFVGLLSHAGHAYGAAGADSVRAIAREECAILDRVAVRLAADGIPVPERSVGATPTALVSEAYDGITEIRPGNYVFLDMTQVRIGVAPLEQVSLAVLSTVVSANDTYLICDAGSKVLSSDLAPHGGGGAVGFGRAYPEDAIFGEGPGLAVAKLSEEHGWIEHGGRALAIGSRVRIVPNHSCPTVNLADQLVILGGQNSPDYWAVAARGRVK